MIFTLSFLLNKFLVILRISRHDNEQDFHIWFMEFGILYFDIWFNIFIFWYYDILIFDLMINTILTFVDLVSLIIYHIILWYISYLIFWVWWELPSLITYHIISYVIYFCIWFLKFGESYLALFLSAGTYHRLRVFPSSRCSEEMTIRKSRIILRLKITSI